MWEGIYAISRIITAIITGVLGPIILWWAKEKYEDSPEEDPSKRTVTEEIQFAQNISQELESIRKEISSDRIWIAQFHNGGQILNAGRKSSMKKISITHEVTDKGVSKEKYKIDGVLVSFFSEMIDSIITKEHISYRDDTEGMDPEVKLLLRERGTEQMEMFAMKNIDGVLIGIMGADFTSSGRELHEKEIQYLKVKANLLAGYIINGQVNLPNNNE